MNVLLLTRYSEAGASSRYRFYQFVRPLAKLGFEFRSSALLGGDYVAGLYTGRRPDAGAVARSYVRRILLLLRAGRFDRVWVEGELLPWVPPLAEILLDRLRVPIVVDYDDALFHRYDRHESLAVRLVLGRKIDRVMAHAATVVAGNDYVAERARAAGARRVVAIPTVVDETRYPETPPDRPDRTVIGWIGTPFTERHLALIAPALRELCAGGTAELRAVGPSEAFRLPGVPFTRVAWSPQTESEVLRGFSVGVMPLEDTPFERGKCGFKLVQYMACHLPVVASPVGANRAIVVPGTTGFLPSSMAEWVHALRTLASDRKLATQMGAAGRARMLQHYSLRAALPRIAEALSA